MSLPVVICKFPYIEVIDDYRSNSYSPYLPERIGISESLDLQKNLKTEPGIPFSNKCPPDTIIQSEKEQQQFLADLLYFQTTCDHPAIKAMMQKIMMLKYETLQEKTEKAELKNFLAQHSETIFKDVAKGLYDVIKMSPKLKKKLDQFQLESDNIEIKELIGKLEGSDTSIHKELKSISENWVWIIPEKEPLLIDMDLPNLKELQRQINILEKAGRSAGKEQSFFLEIEQLRRETHSIPKQTWGKALCKAGTLTWKAIMGIYYVVTLVKSATPTALALAPFILPLPWLSCIQFLLKVFT